MDAGVVAAQERTQYREWTFFSASTRHPLEILEIRTPKGNRQLFSSLQVLHFVILIWIRCFTVEACFRSRASASRKARPARITFVVVIVIVPIVVAAANAGVGPPPPFYLFKISSVVSTPLFPTLFPPVGCAQEAHRQELTPCLNLQEI